MLQKLLKKKINDTYCLERNIENNTALLFVKMLLFLILDRLGKIFVINKSEQFGGEVKYGERYL